MFSQTPSIVPSEVAGRVAEGWHIVDVRTHDEWAQGHVEGAVHIPMDQVVARLDEVGDQVICLCAVGARSERVAQYLTAQGREAVNLEGGIYALADAGYPIVG